ncbi:hypothetical protein KI387_008775 [Taxus chinensis]|uniref:Uncharacterized protein n=1 Tax=Taxus chinensis TaxID=29808 RepID=A0AA38CMJ8_TAXCH|nr:hypothetical protein KI387_008775 [Taxus chinensis]
MRIVSDKKDYSFVEKVQLLENEILGLSNKLVPASASAYSVNLPRTRINFNALSQLCFPAVGFYGDKKTMIKIFRMEFLLEESVLAQMEEGTWFEPGFYVSVPQEAGGLLLAFYWHEGEKVKIILFNPTPGKVRSSPKKSKVEGTIKIVTNSSLSVIRDWLERMVPYELKILESNIVFTAFLLSCDEHMALKFMKQNLKTYNLYILPNDFQSLYQKYKNCSPSQSTVDRAALLSHDTLKTLCCEAYESQVQIFFQNVRKELSANMQKKEVDFNGSTYINKEKE